MKELLENIDKYLALPKDHKRDFLDQLYQYLVNNNATAVDYQRVKIQSTAAICPDCKRLDFYSLIINSSGIAINEVLI